MCKNEGLGMKSDEVSKSLNQHHNIDLYIGVSAAGKTYQLKHKVLDLVSINVQISNPYKIYVVGRAVEWSIFSGVEFIDIETFNFDMLDNINWSPDSILILDSLELYKSADFEFKFCDFLSKYGENLTHIILSCISVDQVSYNILSGLHSAYIGKLFRSELIPLCKGLGIDFMEYELECMKFKKVDLGIDDC